MGAVRVVDFTIPNLLDFCHCVVNAFYCVILLSRSVALQVEIYVATIPKMAKVELGND